VNTVNHILDIIRDKEVLKVQRASAPCTHSHRATLSWYAGLQL